MKTISLCMIVKNEEDVLERCLKSVRDFIDEIIIVDTGSRDDTYQVASRFTNNIYTFDWIDDFSAARNYAFSKATMDYCMWLDADDIIEECDRQNFFSLKASLTDLVDVVMMRYNTNFDESGTPTFWYYRERLLRNNGNYKWQGAVHEAIIPSGHVIYSDAAVTHCKLHEGDPDRNLNIYRRMIRNGKSLNARERYYYGRELYYHQMYQEALDTLHKFILLPDAWVENKIEACILMANCYRLTKQPENAFQSLLQSLHYDIPRPEVCCEFGDYFMSLEQYSIAVFWYETALNYHSESHKYGFVSPNFHTFIPALQLCVCYDKMGLPEKAEEYNEIAGTYKPASNAYLYNKQYFDNKRK